MSFTKPSHSRSARRRTIALMSGIVITALTFGAATNVSTAATRKKKTLTIGVAEANTEISFLAVLDKAIKDEATKNGMKTVILNGKFDNALQAANVKTLIAKRVDIILVISSSPTAVVPALKQAKKAGIPVIAVNAQLDADAPIITYVGASDFQYGQAQGELILEALPKGGNIAIILGPPGDTPTVQRLAGMKDILDKHPEVKIIATPEDRFDNAKNLAVTQDLLTKYKKGEIDLIAAEGPQMYVGAEYARKQGRDDVIFIAGDHPIQVEAAIKSGAIYGTVNQSPILEGKLGAQYAYEWLLGDKTKVPRPKFLVPLPKITKANVDSNPGEWSF
jgi:ABC-type sugar transport system substrate-binding protein